MMRFASRTQWIATGLRPRDDKSGEGMECASSMTIHTLCHCEEGTKVTDAAIHRVSHERVRLVSSLTGSQWIATGLRPRDDKLVKEWSVDYDDIHIFVIARRNEVTTRQSIVSRGTRTTCLFAYWLTVDRHGHTPSR